MPDTYKSTDEVPNELRQIYANAALLRNEVEAGRRSVIISASHHNTPSLIAHAQGSVGKDYIALRAFLHDIEASDEYKLAVATLEPLIKKENEARQAALAERERVAKELADHQQAFEAKQAKANADFNNHPETKSLREKLAKAGETMRNLLSTK